ncbi:MAG: hypothetical protein NVS2B17_33770 [Candidatus Velthaea sp.]
MDISSQQVTGAVHSEPASDKTIVAPPGAVEPRNAAEVPATGPVAKKDEPLTGALAQLLGAQSAPQADTIEVSYRVSSDHDIVTVFTDHQTGKEIAQFPKEMIVEIAAFFDKQSGITVDRRA